MTSSEGNVITSRQMAGVEWGRPLAIGWSGHMGVNYQRAKCINERGKTLLKVCSLAHVGMFHEPQHNFVSAT